MVFYIYEKGVKKRIIVDDEDYEEIIKYRWNICSGYAATKIKGKTVYLHRFIMKPPTNMVVDHLNHNKLDNRKKNLRICTVRENNLNRKSKNYCWNKATNRWVVRASMRGESICRTFKNEDDAKRAVQQIKSGVVPENRKYKKINGKFLPEYIYRYSSGGKFAGYKFMCCKGGKIRVKYGFKTVAEAVKYRDSIGLAKFA